MSRAALDAHHSGSAKPVSLGLLHEDEVRALMAPYLDVDTVISMGRCTRSAEEKSIKNSPGGGRGCFFMPAGCRRSGVAAPAH